MKCLRTILDFFYTTYFCSHFSYTYLHKTSNSWEKIRSSFITAKQNHAYFSSTMDIYDDNIIMTKDIDLGFQQKNIFGSRENDFLHLTGHISPLETNLIQVNINVFMNDYIHALTVVVKVFCLFFMIISFYILYISINNIDDNVCIISFFAVLVNLLCVCHPAYFKFESNSLNKVVTKYIMQQ